MATLTLSLILSIGVVGAMKSLGQRQSAPIDMDNLFAELFWIGVFSLTAKAALSISYDEEDDTNPVHCKLMCLIGFLYCFLVDRSLFAYTFGPENILLSLAILVLTMIMLCIHAYRYRKNRDDDS